MHFLWAVAAVALLVIAYLLVVLEAVIRLLQKWLSCRLIPPMKSLWEVEQIPEKEYKVEQLRLLGIKLAVAREQTMLTSLGMEDLKEEDFLMEMVTTGKEIDPAPMENQVRLGNSGNHLVSCMPEAVAQIAIQMVAKAVAVD